MVSLALRLFVQNLILFQGKIYFLFYVVSIKESLNVLKSSALA